MVLLFVIPAPGGLPAEANRPHATGFKFGVFHLLGGLLTKTIESHQPIVVTLTGVALVLLSLAKGATPDSGGQKCPHSHVRLKPMLVLLQCPNNLILSILLLLSNNINIIYINILILLLLIYCYIIIIILLL